MRAILNLTIWFLVLACNSLVNHETEKVRADPEAVRHTLASNKGDTAIPKLSMLILPAYDEIANEGISPDIQRILEKAFSDDSAFQLIRFPYRQLMNVRYQQIFDRKYCKAIKAKVNTEIIVMTKLRQVARTGNMNTNVWNLEIKVYNTKTNKQFLSNVSGFDLTIDRFESFIKSRQQELFSEVKNSRRQVL